MSDSRSVSELVVWDIDLLAAAWPASEFPELYQDPQTLSNLAQLECRVLLRDSSDPVAQIFVESVAQTFGNITLADYLYANFPAEVAERALTAKSDCDVKSVKAAFDQVARDVVQETWPDLPPSEITKRSKHLATKFLEVLGELDNLRKN